jgi:hypothetical protein
MAARVYANKIILKRKRSAMCLLQAADRFFFFA